MINKNSDKGNNKRYRIINVQKTKYNMVLITGDKSDMIKILPNVLFISTVMTIKTETNCGSKNSLSGVVILMMGMLP